MEQPDLHNLKYGIIYIYSDPERMTLLHGAASLLHKIVYPMDIEWVDEPGREGALFVARRFNVGNVGRYATVSLRTSEHNRGGGQMKALYHFTDVLMGVSDPDSGDVVIDEDDYSLVRYSISVDSVADYMRDEMPQPCAAPQDKTRVKKPKFPRFERLKKRLKDFTEEAADDMCAGSDFEASVVLNEEKKYCREAEEDVPDLLQEEEDRELARLERERQRALERIKREIVNYIAQYHDDPKELMAELLRGKVVVGQPGRLLVNGDMRIVLPEYDELEIEMPAMCRTLYILFMRQSKLGQGIVLKDIDRYRADILEIYGLVKPGANEKRVMRSVENLCNPFGESLNQMISRINHCIRNVITDSELAKSYIISGKKGEPYGISLAPEYLELPRAVTA